MLPLAAMAAGLLVLGDLARHLEAALALLALGFAALPLAARRLARAGAPAATVLAVALGLRLALLPLAPALSNDLLRYAWDGRVAAAGANPYRLAPEAPELAGLRDGLWHRLEHRDVPTVYPPLALGLFTLAALTPAPLLAIKAALVAADLAACWLLLGLARRLGVPAAHTVFYAWNPLVVLEVAGMGHVDALGVAAVLAAVLAVLSARPLAAGCLAAAGALAKLVPLVALPAWSRASRRPWRLLAAALGLTAAGLLPLAATTGVPPGLVTYGVRWEFNGPVFEPLWRLLAAADADLWAARAVDRLKDWSGAHHALDRLYPYLYPQFLAKVLLAGGILAVIVRSWRSRGAVALETGRLLGGVLLLSATVYPWYLLWVLPFAALARHRAWLALSALSLLSYLPQFRELELVPWVFAAIWLPFAALWWPGRRWSIA